MNESIHGSWHRDLSSTTTEASLGEIYWEPIGWQHAIWRYETTNHHYLLNLLAKTGLSTWQVTTGAEEWEFNEAAMRLLPFLCAIAALGAWALLVHRLGFSTAASIVPWIIALHPWYQQHATGMRGYPLLFLFLPLTLLSALSILKSGKWHSWLCYACAQFLFVYSWPGGALVMVIFNFCLVAAVIRKFRLPVERNDQLKRWFVANLLTLMILMPLIAPGFFQIQPYLQNEILRANMGFPWLKNLVSFFFCGCPWPQVDSYSVRSGTHITGEKLWLTHPILFCLNAALVISMLTLGIIQLTKQQPSFARLLTVGLLLAPALTYLKATLGTTGDDVFIFQWYFIYTLPLFCSLAAIGLGFIANHIRQKLTANTSWQRTAAAALVISSLGLYTSLVFPKSLSLHQNSVDPRRESARSVRGGLPLTNPNNAKFLTAHVFRVAQIYDPFGWIVKSASNDNLAGSPPGLTQLMSIADTHDLDLYVNVGFPSEARKKYPDIMDLIERSGFFDIHSQHYGLEPQFERVVYHYRGGLFKFDFSHPKAEP